ncbi:C4-dicarboxylate ABC transporter permease [Acidovorax sp. Leaf76]|jgi:TRAP-type transport system small permease protein|uniref:TRAP transporter small permease n=1 Tax=unclassified Acidovorax TaxID=2684926 RepID=UPI0006FC1D6F|nr:MULTISPECIES: TRAP transporter small permease [unclassified Acidovorax]KQO24648.1 C4-dicarboxylate ABC transporter permease [Acidovorax sp. Leaf76]KQO39654.1 C4-dicarboxylate ABC transporter permease [Acidovorax sp. Leaf84]KQS24941.1 C4-dicarboxylate ABC transporter permease [Acidovorax sp. Leaf191]
MLNTVIDRYVRAINLLIALALAAMVVLVFGNVVLRYVFNSGIAVSEELSRWLFVWITFLGAVAAIKENAHLGTDMLVSRLSVRGKKACMALGHVLMLYITWLFFDGSWQQMKINWDVEAPVTGASMAIFYASGVVFSVCAGFLLTLQLLRVLTGKASEDELVMVKESEEQAELEALQAELAREDAAARALGQTPKQRGQ